MEGPQQDSKPLPSENLPFPHLAPDVVTNQPATRPATESQPRWMIWGLLIGAGMLAVGAGALLLSSDPQSQAQQSQTAGQTTGASTTASSGVAPVVSVVPVQTTQVPQLLAVTGFVRAEVLLPVVAPLTGLRIESVNVEKGATVLAGQVLAVLDTTSLKTQVQEATASYQRAAAAVGLQQAAVEQAQARLTKIQAGAQRYQQLLQQGAISQQEAQALSPNLALQEVQMARANLASAQASAASAADRVQQLQAQLAQVSTEVRAPVAGTIANSFASIGAVTSGKQLFLLARGDQLKLEAQVSGGEAARLQPGQPVEVRSSSNKGLEINGQVRAVDSAANSSSGPVTVHIALPPNPQLKPGMTLNGRVLLGQAQGMVLPPSAVNAQPDGSHHVFVVDESNVARARVVKLGIQSTGAVQITEGVQPGDRVVISGANLIQDGDSVTVSPNNAVPNIEPNTTVP
ncbi:efflux RND transporter periplasmic adaptor subunit [Leptolyngbya sp. FACHB-261]|uniref:efflux RND transporter periplasmic adaptor subunit n=1 Tax=Leptolyngbya sp. FACHB-261 TaxID=2692806 RepID=UPI001686C472|nr:efflux RND transporter periplasmic adaptor subunit [Leptolyngbya sp. FACHB-261]MBD2104167.1 efflux RND transporter periplasmic adaptor subunit [Leptolyngbya sp. FACHB-261]